MVSQLQTDSRPRAAIPVLAAEQVRRMVGMLVLPTAVSVGMVLGRFAYVADLRFRFCGLLLNLLLAWMPMALALLIWRTPQTRRLALSGLFAAWLLFFPNAFYLTTDLVHSHKFGTDGVLRWYDILMTACFATSGMFLGSVSLFLLHSVVRARFGARSGWLFAGAALSLGAFGVYLGRFLRFNSWDALARPGALLEGIRVAFEAGSGAEVAAFCGGFFLFSGLVYSFVYSLAHLHKGT